MKSLRGRCQNPSRSCCYKFPSRICTQQLLILLRADSSLSSLVQYRYFLGLAVEENRTSLCTPMEMMRSFHSTNDGCLTVPTFSVRATTKLGDEHFFQFNMLKLVSSSTTNPFESGLHKESRFLCRRSTSMG